MPLDSWDQQATPMPVAPAPSFDWGSALGALGLGLSGAAGSIGQSPILSQLTSHTMQQRQLQQQEQQGFQQASQGISWASQNAKGDPTKELQYLGQFLEAGGVRSPVASKLILSRMSQLEAPAREWEQGQKATQATTPILAEMFGRGGAAGSTPPAAPPASPESPQMTDFVGQAPGPAPAATAPPTPPLSSPARMTQERYQYRLQTEGKLPEPLAAAIASKSGLPHEQDISEAVAKARGQADVDVEKFRKMTPAEIERKRAEIPVDVERDTALIGPRAAQAGATTTATEQAKGEYALGPQAQRVREVERNEIGVRATEAKNLDMASREAWNVGSGGQSEVALAGQKAAATGNATFANSAKLQQVGAATQLYKQETDRLTKQFDMLGGVDSLTADMRRLVAEGKELGLTTSVPSVNWLKQQAALKMGSPDSKEAAWVREMETLNARFTTVARSIENLTGNRITDTQMKFAMGYHPTPTDPYTTQEKIIGALEQARVAAHEDLMKNSERGRSQFQQTLQGAGVPLLMPSVQPNPSPSTAPSGAPPQPGMIRVRRRSDGAPGWLDPKDLGPQYERIE